MKFHAQEYKIKDEPMKPFIDADEIWEHINNATPEKERVREIIQRALNKNRLTLEETAVLVNVKDPELINEIKKGAQELKEKVYGHRIVLFAPLYIGNKCTNNCSYCGFKASNKTTKRVTLSEKEIVEQVKALEDVGQKRLILVYGEHPKYDAKFIADSVKTVYGVKSGNGEIRRVNINAAPLSIEDYKIVKDSGIGTYQVFQETYHPEAYKKYHLGGKKRDYNWRLTALDRAMEAGLDDVGFGVLFGLYDWRFEVLAMLRHVNHFEAVYNVGPHTLSFPRIKKAAGIDVNEEFQVSDEDFTKLVAILRLAVPYTGLILTAREPSAIRDEILSFGVSQIDGGTNIEMKGYTKKEESQDLDKEQFIINDDRTLGEVIDELIDKGLMPSFCTSCYRTGRTGEHFMEFSVPGFIKKYCTPNAILTFAEYLEDYASEDRKDRGYALVAEKMKEVTDEKLRDKIWDRLEKIKNGVRDLYF